MGFSKYIRDTGATESSYSSHFGERRCTNHREQGRRAYGVVYAENARRLERLV